jgi:hypothetical protein
MRVINNGQISTSSFNGSGGSINITGGKWAQLQNASITSSVFGESSNRAGDIDIEIPIFIIDTARIQA